ncbi:DUF1317 family protein [Escherichia coli]|uniref:DUF1317 family protein n=1 Tax=Escherichia coli TaxID=562 RepID=UPI003F548933
MTHPHDNIRVGAITFVYSVTKRGWVFPGLSVIRNPLKAQRLAEEINNKRGAVSVLLNWRPGLNTQELHT